MNEKVRELLITYGKPHNPLFSDSIGRCIKNESVDTTVFKPHSHSCRLSSVSNAKVNGGPISVILEKGCRKRESAFKKNYFKDIINCKTDGPE